MEKWEERIDLKEAPNAVTLSAMKEAEDMVNHPERYESFDNMADLIKALEA